jgi:hypothetical protein
MTSAALINTQVVSPLFTPFILSILSVSSPFHRLHPAAMTIAPAVPSGKSPVKTAFSWEKDEKGHDEGKEENYRFVNPQQRNYKNVAMQQ